MWELHGKCVSITWMKWGSESKASGAVIITILNPWLPSCTLKSEIHQAWSHWEGWLGKKPFTVKMFILTFINSGSKFSIKQGSQKRSRWPKVKEDPSRSSRHKNKVSVVPVAQLQEVSTCPLSTQQAYLSLKFTNIPLSLYPTTTKVDYTQGGMTTSAR